MSELHKEDVSVDGTVRLMLTFPQAADVAVAVEGARVVSQTLWAGAAELVLEGSGTARIVVTGRKLAQSRRIVTAEAQRPGDAPDGLTETLDNPLITDAAHAPNGYGTGCFCAARTRPSTGAARSSTRGT